MAQDEILISNEEKVSTVTEDTKLQKE